MSVKYKTSGSQFYGLVRQQGPNFVPMDVYREDGGSIQAYGTPTAPMGAGGTLHSGHGSYKTFIDPKHQWNPQKPMSAMEKCVTEDIIFKPTVIGNNNFQIGGRFGAMSRYGGPMDQDPKKITEEVKEKVENPVVANPYQGKIGSAPAVLQPGTRIEEGQSVGDILGTGATIASEVAAVGAPVFAALGVPVLGPAAVAVAAVYSAAAGVAKLFEGRPGEAAQFGLNAFFMGKDAKQGLAAEFAQPVEYGTSTSGRSQYGTATSGSRSGRSQYGTATSGSRFGKGSRFSDSFSGYQEGKTLLVDDDWLAKKGVKEDFKKVEQWLNDSNISVGSDYGSLAEFESELAEITRVAQAAENEEMIARLNRIRNTADVGVQTSGEVQTVNGSRTVGSSALVNTANASAQAGNPEIVQRAVGSSAIVNTADASAQARPDNFQIVEILSNQIEILSDQLGQSEQARMEAAVETAQWLNVLGLNTKATEQAINRGNLDHLKDLVQEAKDNIEYQTMARPLPIELVDQVTETEYNPPTDDLITQAYQNIKIEGPKKRRRKNSSLFVDTTTTTRPNYAESAQSSGRLRSGGSDYVPPKIRSSDYVPPKERPKRKQATSKGVRKKGRK